MSGFCGQNQRKKKLLVEECPDRASGTYWGGEEKQGAWYVQKTKAVPHGGATERQMRG